MLIHEQNYIAEHLGVSVPAEGNAQCLASAFPNSIQSVSLDPGALRDYPPPEFPREGKTYPAVRNVGGKKMCLLWITWTCLRCVRRSVWGTRWRRTWWAKITAWCSEYLLRIALRRNLEQREGDRLASTWNISEAFERTDVFPLLLSACVASLLLGDEYEVARLAVELVEF